MQICETETTMAPFNTES